ncbi:MAG TPA: polysaccharide biosynthesis/export family protein [Terriglobia bacterium]|nr:polysaccharide biosynthesis/export family protein [Terriglobia bacterium]
MDRAWPISWVMDSMLRGRVRFAGFLFLGLALLGSTAVAGAQAIATAKEPEIPGPDIHQSTKAIPGSENLEYVIATDDLLEVYVIDVPELSREYLVSPDGTITLPLLSEPIMAAGLSPNQLSAVIAAKLHSAGMVTHADVTVSVKASRGHSIAISGAVRNPQVYPIFGETTLLNVLSQAGGLADDAADTAVVTRGETAMRAIGLQDSSTGAPASSLPTTIKVNLKKLFEDGDPKSNIPIYPGDTVTVQRAGLVYVVGAVNRAGGYTLARSWEDMTVLKVVALAGNVTSTAQRKKAIIIRKDSSAPGGHEQIPVNLKKILAGRAPDQALEANDILFIPESAGKKALRQGLQTALGVGSNLLIYHAPL